MTEKKSKSRMVFYQKMAQKPANYIVSTVRAELYIGRKKVATITDIMEYKLIEIDDGKRTVVIMDDSNFVVDKVEYKKVRQ